MQMSTALFNGITLRCVPLSQQCLKFGTQRTDIAAFRLSPPPTFKHTKRSEHLQRKLFSDVSGRFLKSELNRDEGGVVPEGAFSVTSQNAAYQHHMILGRGGRC